MWDKTFIPSNVFELLKAKRPFCFLSLFFHGKAKRQKDGYKTERARDGMEDRKRKFGGGGFVFKNWQFPIWIWIIFF
jgi:hypothetical protein